MNIFSVFEIVFFISLLFIFYAYFGYAIIIKVLSIFHKQSITKEKISPNVSVVITAFNEEDRITEKLENSLLIDYPKDKLQILVASDGSTDKTNPIVESYADKGIELLNVLDRKGKENAQKEAVKIATGEILIFTDVATYLKPDGIQNIVNNFADPSIGCVSSVDKIIDDDGNPSGGENAYVRYEMWLRGVECKFNSVVGLSGSFFAARKEVCQDFSPKMQSDFRTLLNSIRLGLRGVSDPEAIGYYKDIKDKSKEFNRKVRTVLRGLTVFFNSLELLNIFKYGFFSLQLLSHKLIRWLVPFFMISTLISNILIININPIYLYILYAQAAFYTLFIVGMLSEKLSDIILIKIPKYFTMVNISILVAWFKFLRGDRQTLWNPSKR